VRDVLQKVVDLDSPAEWARLINERAKVFKKHMPIAFNNLAVAQHRDMLRYTKTRSGTFAPTLQRFVLHELMNLDFLIILVRLLEQLPRARREAGDLLSPEAAEGRLVGSEGWSFSFESQVSRQWGPLGPRGA
jgi:hypothetical protein